MHTAMAIGLLAALAFTSMPSMAINKCTEPGGKVVFQDAPCGLSSQKSEIVKTWDSNLSGRSRQGAWEFRRSIDDMTGQKACFVISPVTSAEPKGREFKFIPVHLAIVVSASGTTFGVRTSTDKDLFHNDISNMGVKLDNLEFIPLDVRAGQHVVGSSMGVQIMEALPKAQNVRLRLRFWPYDTLYDTMSMNTAGFNAAYGQAKQCAGLKN